MKNNYSPDILNCLANLSSDEVFTSPELANRMLDLLPQELFRSSKTRFLDPCSKSGVFLREIAKRLLAGLEEQIPDLQQRIDHIMTKQVFGIACTDLTAEMSRRTLYCTKQANGEYSVASCFDDTQGNLRYMRCQHTWENGKCKYCGANRAQYDRTETIENYAYPFIHKNINEIFKNMQFDVIIGNPPYQMRVNESGHGLGAIPLYNVFVETAMSLKPRFLTMIIPSRWFSGGVGLDAFRKTMLSCEHVKRIVDYIDSTDCFPGVDLNGGVCYFLWDRDYKGLCEYTNIAKGVTSSRTRKLDEFDIFIRRNESISIIHKIRKLKEKCFNSASGCSPQTPYGILSTYQGPDEPSGNSSYQIVSSKGWMYAPLKKDWQNSARRYKTMISKLSCEHAGNPDKNGMYRVLSRMEILKPNQICTQSYLVLCPTDTYEQSVNVFGYLQTRFVRFLILQTLVGMNISIENFKFVPLQDFSHPWTDEMLYKKYDLDKDEIAFIESMIRPME